MKMYSKEFHEAMQSFEKYAIKELIGIGTMGFTKEPRPNWTKGSVYCDGKVNEAFRMYLGGYSCGHFVGYHEGVEAEIKSKAKAEEPKKISVSKHGIYNTVEGFWTCYASACAAGHGSQESWDIAWKKIEELFDLEDCRDKIDSVIYAAYGTSFEKVIWIGTNPVRTQIRWNKDEHLPTVV